MPVEISGVGFSVPIQSNRTAVDEIFKGFDVDKSGGLNLKEAIESGAPDEETFRLADADGNGSVSKDELLKFFDSFDEALNTTEANPKDLVAALKNGNEDLIKQLLQAARDNDEKSIKLTLDKLIVESANNDVSQGTFLDLSA